MMYGVSSAALVASALRPIALLVGWPADVLGPYGENRTTDEDLDRWVTDHVVPPVDRIVTCAVPGRSRTGTPVAVVMLRRKDRHDNDRAPRETWAIELTEG